MNNIAFILIAVIVLLCIFLWRQNEKAFNNGRLIGSIETSIQYEYMPGNKEFYRNWLNDLKKRGYYRYE